MTATTLSLSLKSKFSLYSFLPPPHEPIESFMQRLLMLKISIAVKPSITLSLTAILVLYMA